MDIYSIEVALVLTGLLGLAIITIIKFWGVIYTSDECPTCGLVAEEEDTDTVDFEGKLVKVYECRSCKTQWV